MIEVEEFGLHSMSSVSSINSSSNESSSYSMIRDIKGHLDYNIIPLPLKRLRIIFFLIFIMLIIASIVVFYVTFKAK
jgi:hypothetical protein